MRRTFEYIFLPSILILIVLLSYLPSLGAYFQQDEWLAFSRLITLKSSSIYQSISNIFAPTTGHYTPLNLIVLFIEYSLFGLNFNGYILMSIFWHLLTVMLIYALSLRLFKNKTLSFFLALTFGVLASTYQATGWVIADIGTHLSAIVVLVSLLIYFKFIESGKPAHFYISIVILFVSLLFKENAIATFIVYPFGLFLLGNEKIKKARYYVLPFVFLAIFIAFRLIITKIAPVQGVLISPSIISSDRVYNLISLPPKMFVQSIFSAQVLLFLAKVLATNIYSFVRPELAIGTWQFDVFVEQVVLEVVTITLFIVITVLSLINLRRKYDKPFSRLFLFWFIFSLINSFVFVLSPERVGRITIVDSRNLYLVSIGVVFALGSFRYQFAGHKRMMILIFGTFIITNIYLLYSTQKNFILDGKTRKGILNTIKYNHPTLPKKVLFYTVSDRSYYGVPSQEKILPFQSGFGQTLLIWYYPDMKFPREFLENRYLWEIRDQGYKEVGEYGFGYFRDKELLKTTLKSYNLPTDSVIGLSWDSSTNKLSDISDAIREVLRNER